MSQLFSHAKATAKKALRETYPFFQSRAKAIIRPPRPPSAPWHNAVLRKHSEIIDALHGLRSIGLYPHRDTPKNWDSLAALDCVLENTDRTSQILDAGAETYSVILPWLALYGYKNLYGINLVFDKRRRMGPIVFEYGDITNTGYDNDRFDAITCMSVIEHGVDLPQYLREMHRILKSGGVLVTSTDYWETPIDAQGKQMYGTPVRVFNANEIRAAIRDAENVGFELTSSIDLSCEEKVVHWRAIDLRFTFINFSLRKTK